MKSSFNTQVGNGEYRLQFETDSKEHYQFMQKAARMCIDDKLPSIDTQRWIPANEPPEKWAYSSKRHTIHMVDYLAYSQADGVMYLANWFEPAKRWLANGESVNVTHWMPLPEPPKEY